MGKWDANVILEWLSTCSLPFLYKQSFPHFPSIHEIKDLREEVKTLELETKLSGDSFQLKVSDQPQIFKKWRSVSVMGWSPFRRLWASMSLVRPECRCPPGGRAGGLWHCTQASTL